MSSVATATVTSPAPSPPSAPESTVAAAPELNNSSAESTAFTSTKSEISAPTVAIPPTPLTASNMRSPKTISPKIIIPATPLTASNTAMSPTPTSATLPSYRTKSLKSPLPSELPRSPMSATFAPPVDGQKTPITPPPAYTDFLKNAIASPSDLKSPKFLPHHHPSSSGVASAGPASPMFSPQYIHQAGKRYRASLSGPSGGMPSPGLLSAGLTPYSARRDPYTPTQSSGLASSANSSSSSLASSSSSGSSSNSNSKVENISTPATSGPPSGASAKLKESVVSESSSRKVVRFVKSEGNSPSGKLVVEVGLEKDKDKEKEKESGKQKEEDGDAMEVEETQAQEGEVMEQVDCTRRKSINKDGTVTIKQVVTTTVTFKPKMSLMPAPKGKRRRIE